MKEGIRQLVSDNNDGNVYPWNLCLKRQSHSLAIEVASNWRITAHSPFGGYEIGEINEIGVQGQVSRIILTNPKQTPEYVRGPSVFRVLIPSFRVI